MLMLQDMMAAALPRPVPGQAVFTASGTFTVPPFVTSLCVLCVQPGGDTSTTGSEVLVAGVTVCRAKNGARVGDGGGDGGFVGPYYTLSTPYTYYIGFGGGGGAGGYAGNGGNGGYFDSNGASIAPTAGAGGGGGGGSHQGILDGNGAINPNFKRGGGVGLLGEGVSGAPGAVNSGTPGGDGSGGSNGLYGAGGPNDPRAGALAYRNNVAVVPGTLVTVTVPASGSANGAVRLLWAGNRSYPSNAGNL
jgi:hypothetical protein